MKKTASWLVLVATWLCASTAFAGEPRVGKFVKYDTGDYVIVTSRSSAQAKRFMEDLVKFRLTLERVLGKRATPNAFPTTIVITSASDWNKWLIPRQNVAGFFQGARFANYMAINGDAPLSDALHVMFHEYTHYYLGSQFAGEYPPWFNEGMAELMGYAKFDKGMAILQIPMHRVYEAREGNWIPFDRLIRVDHTDPEYQSHRLAPSFYAQSWLAVQYGMVENRDFGKQIFAYLHELNTLEPQAVAARIGFGDDLSVPDKQLREYLRASERHSGTINLGSVPPMELPQGKPLGELDTLATLVDLMLESRLAPDRIRPLVESLERRDPNKARAAILAARLAQLDEDNAAFDRAVAKAEAALAPGDWEQRRELASVLLASGLEGGPLSTRSSEQTERDVKRSLKWFAEVITHNNEDVEALYGFGTAATRLDRNLDLAEQALVSAYKRAPASAEIAMSLANLKARQEKPDEMLPFLKDVIRNANNLGMRRWAAETYIQTQEYIVERDKVEAENRKQREAYEKMRDEYEKKYGKRKKASQ
jgi:tetratricopeptide (TPR) repeat protein